MKKALLILGFYYPDTKLDRLTMKPKFKPDETQFTHHAYIQYFNKLNQVEIMPIYLQLCECTDVMAKFEKKTESIYTWEMTLY